MLIAKLLYNLLAAALLEAFKALEVGGGRGEGGDRSLLIFNFSFFYVKYFVGFIFSRGNFSWKVDGTLTKNSYKPSKDLLETTL